VLFNRLSLHSHLSFTQNTSAFYKVFLAMYYISYTCPDVLLLHIQFLSS